MATESYEQRRNRLLNASAGREFGSSHVVEAVLDLEAAVTHLDQTSARLSMQIVNLTRLLVFLTIVLVILTAVIAEPTIIEIGSKLWSLVAK